MYVFLLDVGLVMWWESSHHIPQNTSEMYLLYEIVLKQTMEQVQIKGIDPIASVLLLRYIIHLNNIQMYHYYMAIVHN